MKNPLRPFFIRRFFSLLLLVNVHCISISSFANAQTNIKLDTANSRHQTIADLLAQLKAAELNSSDSSLANALRVKLGVAYSQSRQTKDALRMLMNAANNYQSSADQVAYASTLQILGSTWKNYGGIKESILAFAKSVSVWSELGVGHEKELANVTLDLAKINLSSDLLELALIHAKSALTICETQLPEMQMCIQHAKAIIGDVYMEAGDFATALKYYEEIVRTLDTMTEQDHQFSLEIQANFLWVQAKIFNTQEARFAAIHGFEETLHHIESTTGNESLEVGIYLNKMTPLYLENRQSDLAIKTIVRSIQLIELHQGKTSMVLLKPSINYAAALYQQEAFDAMLDQLMRALSFSAHDESLKNALIVSDLLTDYSQIKGNFQAAVHFSKRTAEIGLYSGRALRLSNPQLGRNYVANRIQIFRKLIHYLLRQNRLIEAQDALDLLRENEYLDFVGEIGDEMRTAQRNAFEEQIRLQFNAENYTYFYAVYQAEADRLNIDVNTENGNTQAPNQQEMVLHDNIAAKANRLHTFIQNFFGIFQQQESSSIPPPIESLKKTELKLAFLAQLKKSTATLQYFVTNDKLYLLLNTKHSQILKHLDISENLLQSKVNAFLFSVQNPNQDPIPNAIDLYQLLIKPIELELQQSGIKTILISPDSVLKKVPFAALHNGNRYLVQEYDTAMLTQSSWSNSIDHTKNQHTIGAFGLTASKRGLRALPGVKKELQSIVKNKPNGIFLGEIKLDHEFTEANLSAALLKKYSILHIASHFIFLPRRDTDSFLLLGDGSTLSINQLKQKRFDFSHIDLVVLSACDTAKYDKNLNGIPVDGLANVLQMRGAKTVLATQWAIEDKSTSILMPRFYQNLASQLNKAEALSKAQRSFIEQNLNVEKTHHQTRGLIRQFDGVKFAVNPKRPFAHPYYWAGFLLMGGIE